MKKIIMVAAAVFIFSAQSAFAISIRVEATDTDFQPLIDLLNNEISKKLDDYGSTSAFAAATGNAASYTYNTGALVGYQDYRAFKISAGGMVSTAGMIDPGDDVGFGAATAGAINAGIKANWILNLLGLKGANNFYLSARLGGVPETKVPLTFSGVSGTVEGSAMIAGVGMNYSIIESIGIVVAGWKGLSFGTGVYYITQDVIYTQSVKYNKSTVVDIGGTDTAISISYDGDIPLEVEVRNITIPVELITGFNFFGISLTGGAGVDFNIGNTKLSSEPTGAIMGQVDVAPAEEVGVFVIDLDDGKTSTINYKLLAAVGVAMGPIKLEIPVYYYPGNDFSFGVTAGIVF